MATVAINLPTTVFPAEVRSTSAINWMRAAYNNICKCNKGKHPTSATVSTDLYEALESEFVANMRFTESVRAPEPSIMFKGIRVYKSAQGGGWWSSFSFA